MAIETYLQFDEAGNQVQACAKAGHPGDNWYKVPKDYAPVKRYRFVDGGMIEVTEEQQKEERRKKTIKECVHRIKRYRDDRIVSGGFPHAEHWWHSDVRSRSHHQRLQANANNIEDFPPWVDMEGNDVRLTREIAGGIDTAGTKHEIAIYAAARSHIAAMKLSDHPESYDFTGDIPKKFFDILKKAAAKNPSGPQPVKGWPAMYGK
uniref:DUF4376 domain-containing protein n=1 Tax=Candidatus Kentrum sp. LFY TaxID=2126342 RepID=A0A450WH78_9GAMM|nr:MAG: protein of unknown function (DUF4376) [Candidatus Kentron sp. LFY]